MLPMLQLSSGMPNTTHQIPGGHWLVRKPVTPRGKAFRAHDLGVRILEISPIAVRYKAVDFSNHSQAIVSYRPETTLYKKIVNKADYAAQTACQYGPEILVYIHHPEHSGLATLFGGSKTSRTEYARYLMDGHITYHHKMFPVVKVESRHCSSPRHNFHWYTPRISPTSFYWEPGDDVPNDVLQKFMNPPSRTIELPSRLQTGFAAVTEALEGYSQEDQWSIVKAVIDGHDEAIDA